jgi:hypothetical protein
VVKELELTQGKVAIVDDSDFEHLNQWKWYCSSKGYAVRNIPVNGKQTLQLMHAVIINTPPGMQTDHINGDRLDNRKENLRICTCSENQWNQHKVRGESKYKGVSYHKRHNKWYAQIRINGKRIYIGVFKDEIDAAKAYNEAATRYFGEFAKINEMEGRR